MGFLINLTKEVHNPLPLFSMLWDTFLKAASDDHAGEVIFIVDALDECADQERLAEHLTELYLDGSGPSSLKFLLTSRPYLRIKQRFQDLKAHQPTIHLSGESQEEGDKIAQEIAVVIQNRVNRLCEHLQLESEDKDYLHSKLANVENRTYLWAHLVFASLENAFGSFISSVDLRRAIDLLPRTVDEAYENILQKASDPEKAKKILQIVVVAPRPLHLREMATALCLREEHTCHDDLNPWPEDQVQLVLRETCGLFVIVQNSQVSLLHQTAREFLIDPSDKHSNKNLATSTWHHSVGLTNSCHLLSAICIRYLLLDRVGKYGDCGKLSQKNDNESVLLDFAAKHWVDLYSRVQGLCDGRLNTLALQLCRAGTPACYNWLTTYSAQATWGKSYEANDELSTTLLVVSYFGLHTLVRIVLNEDKRSIKVRSPHYERTALSWAIGNGHDSTVQILLGGLTKRRVTLQDRILKHGPFPTTIVNQADRYEETPLLLAAKTGHLGIVEQLLRRGAEIEHKDDWGRTALMKASYSGHYAVVKFLLQRGAQIDTVDEGGWSALSYALYEGHLSVANTLLEAKAYICPANIYGHTALMQASIGGSVQLVEKFLLEMGAQIESTDNNGQTALMVASSHGNERVVELLLKSGARIESTDNDGQTALMAASSHGNERVVELLLKSGARIESTDNDGQTALMLVSSHGHQRVVELLLKSGARIESTDNDGQTALMLASSHSHERVVELLLESGARIESTDDNGRRALMYASAVGEVAVMEVLLVRGAQAETADKDGWTALKWALREGRDKDGSKWPKVINFRPAIPHDAVIEKLLKNGAKADHLCEEDRAALGRKGFAAYLTIPGGVVGVDGEGPWK